MIPYYTLPPLKIAGLQFDLFGALVATGFLVGSSLAARRARNVGLSVTSMYDITLLCLIFGFLGAHLGHVLITRPRDVIERPLELLKIWSGISSMGGFLGASISIWFFAKRQSLPFLKYADALLFGLVPGWVFGRLGCYTAHDHPGRLTDFFLAVNYPGGARHDLGFYEALVAVALTGLVFLLGRSKNPESPKPGTILAWVLCLYGVARFLLDFLRATDLATSERRYLGLTPAQYISIGGVLFGLHLFHRIRPDKAVR